MHCKWLGQPPGGAESSPFITGGNVIVHQPKPRTDKQIAAIEAVCAACKNNVDWICQHVGCRPCRQQRIGGLKTAIRNPYFQCPAGKFKT